ncbi:MAG TPA: membrane protein insertion efficiency factor YidD [Chryseolinea sp.]
MTNSFRDLILSRRVGPSQMRGWPGMRGEAYLLIPASMHTALREPHTHSHARALSVWLLIFLVLFVPACAKPLRRRHGQDKKNIINFVQRLFCRLLLQKHARIKVTVLRKIFILPIRLYQLTLSPLIGANCRHTPTCSQYAIEAIMEWGVIKGIWLGTKRILRCHPWGTFGYDPVPKKKQSKQ